MMPNLNDKQHIHIQLCYYCQSPLFATSSNARLVPFYDELLKRDMGLTHEHCATMQSWCLGQNAHLIAKEQAEA